MFQNTWLNSIGLGMSNLIQSMIEVSSVQIFTAEKKEHTIFEL